MTAISSLQSIHKKGIFGDHHKKDQKDLLKVSEVKNLNIVQLVQYKNSKIQKSNIKIDGIELPQESSEILSNKETRIFWNAPNTWLVISKKNNIQWQSMKRILQSKWKFFVSDQVYIQIIFLKGNPPMRNLHWGCS